MPALSHSTAVYGITDAKIYKVTADPSGGSTTYGAAIDIPGARFLTITPAVGIKDLRGDNGPLAAAQSLDTITATLEGAKVPLDALPVLWGGSVVDSGTTPNQVTTWSMADPPVFSHFKIEAKSASTDVGIADLHYILYKCTMSTAPPMGLGNEDYVMFNFQVRVERRESDGKRLDLALYETVTALAS